MLETGKPAKHTLIVGGSGMLSEVALHCAREGQIVTVIARGIPALQALADAAVDCRGRILPLALDYRDGQALVAGIRNAIAEHGPILNAVCWIHSTAPDAPLQVAASIGKWNQGQSCRYFDVLGSAAASPAARGDKRRQLIAQITNILYRSIVLGFVREKGFSRWLTHREIAGGLIGALKDDRTEMIIGQVEPWRLRP